MQNTPRTWGARQSPSPSSPFRLVRLPPGLGASPVPALQMGMAPGVSPQVTLRRMGPLIFRTRRQQGAVAYRRRRQ
eukprot:2315223-Rhodomonas_salina.1